MTTNSQLSTTEPKTKTNSANILNKNTITKMEITWRVFSGEGEVEIGGKVQGISSIIGR